MTTIKDHRYIVAIRVDCDWSVKPKTHFFGFDSEDQAKKFQADLGKIDGVWTAFADTKEGQPEV